MSMIGCCVWIMLLGRFDFAFSTFAMPGFNMSPKEGNLKAFKIILSYLMNSSKRRIKVDTTYLDN
jgi:hypothetical protein